MFVALFIVGTGIVCPILLYKWVWIKKIYVPNILNNLNMTHEANATYPLVNKFYYPERSEIVFTSISKPCYVVSDMKWPCIHYGFILNLPSEMSAILVSEISFSDGLKNKTRAACRIFGLGDIKKSFKKILNDFRPDIVHFHNIHFIFLRLS